MKKHAASTLAKALCPSLVLALGSQFIGTPQAVAQATGDTTEMKKVIVTGSAIPTAETVGAAPVDVIGVQDIARTGSQDVLSIVRKLNPAFSGNGNVGNTVNNGGFGEVNVALRNLNTLVLIDGRRLASSGFSQGVAVDLATIPPNMIDRIEILKDGASTIYGSDAIGGVVNIITKQSYNGAEISGRIGFAMDHTSNDMMEYRASVVAGASDDKSSFVIGANYYTSDPLLSKDRFDSSATIAQLAAIGVTAPGYVSPTYPGRVQNPGSFILAGAPEASGLGGFNAAITTPPVDYGVSYAPIPANPILGTPAVTSIQQYNAAHPGVYLPQGATALLNTTDFGTFSQQKTDRKQFFGHGEHQLMGKELVLYADVLYSNTHSTGELAPPPLTSLVVDGLSIPGNNPYNPFQIPLGVGAPAANNALNIRTRLIDSGNRVFVSDKDYYRAVVGAKGEFDSGWRYDTAFNYNHSSDLQSIQNAVSGAALNAALIPDLVTPNPAGLPAGFPAKSYYSTLIGADGNPVPVYNYFSLPGQNSRATLNAISTTLFEHAITDLASWDGRISGELPWKLPAGSVGVAVGGDWRTESLEIQADGLYNSNAALGFNAIQNLPQRFIEEGAGYMEISVPVFSPDYNVPGAHALELNASGRIAQFEPSGAISGVPKFGFRWQPIDEQLTVRGTWSQGFITPTIFSLFGPPLQNVPTVTDSTGTTGQVLVNQLSNANLPNAKSETWTGGVVWTPKFLKGFTVSVDYYRILETGLSTIDSAQNAITSLDALGSASPYAPSFTFNSGAKLTTTAPNQVTVANWGAASVTQVPGNAQFTDGIDFDASYQFDADAFGKFTIGTKANLLLDYLFRTPGQPYNQFAGQYTDLNQGPVGAQGSLPEFTIKPYLLWEWRDLTVFANATYIPSIYSEGGLFPSLATGAQGSTASGNTWKVPAYYTIDLQVSYELGKSKADKAWYDGTKVTIGVNNITDQIAPFIAGAFEDNTDKSTYDLIGRFVYLEVSKKF